MEAEPPLSHVPQGLSLSKAEVLRSSSLCYYFYNYDLHVQISCNGITPYSKYCVFKSEEQCPITFACSIFLTGVILFCIYPMTNCPNFSSNSSSEEPSSIFLVKLNYVLKYMFLKDSCEKHYFSTWKPQVSSLENSHRNRPVQHKTPCPSTSSSL